MSNDPKTGAALKSQADDSKLPAGQTPVDDGSGVDKSGAEDALLKKAVATFDDEDGGDTPEIRKPEVADEQKEEQPLKHVNDGGASEKSTT